MKLFLRIVSGVILGCLLGITLTIAANLMSTASDVAVFGGFVVIVVIFAGLFVLAKWALRKYLQKWYRHSDGSYHTFKEE